MSIANKLRQALNDQGYTPGSSAPTELTREQIDQVAIGGADWFEQFHQDSNPFTGGGGFWKEIWHRGVQPQ